MDPCTIVGTLTHKGRRWFASVECVDEPRPGRLVLVRSPTGNEAVVILVKRERLTSRFGTELWEFRVCLKRPTGSADHDREAQREVWLRELELCRRESPVKRFGFAEPRKRRKRRRRRA